MGKAVRAAWSPAEKEKHCQQDERGDPPSLLRAGETHLECPALGCPLQTNMGMCIQQRATKAIKDLEQLTQKRLRELDLFSLEKTQGDLINAYKYLKAGCKEDRDSSFQWYQVRGQEAVGTT
ncbi:hypothetical protein BTVI_08719 [Pitangus sulphuratus]|nr:hypothetical protein BTVI_08719 [Pitangus sulphuratus]